MIGDRQEEARTICGHLAKAVAEIAPLGTGKRDEVWEAVADDDRAFTATMKTWIRAGTDADKQALRTAYRTLLASWRSAMQEPSRTSDAA